MICSICTEICNNDLTLDCGHKFHDNCLIEWLEIKNSCPNCRLINPITKQYYLQAKICGCGSCTLLFTPYEIEIWICNDKIPLCPHCFVDCVFPFSKDFSLDKIKKLLMSKNTKSFGGIARIDNVIEIKDDVVVVVNNGLVMTHFFRSPSFNEYFEMF